MKSEFECPACSMQLEWITNEGSPFRLFCGSYHCQDPICGAGVFAVEASKAYRILKERYGTCRKYSDSYPPKEKSWLHELKQFVNAAVAMEASGQLKRSTPEELQRYYALPHDARLGDFIIILPERYRRRA